MGECGLLCLEILMYLKLLISYHSLCISFPIHFHQIDLHELPPKQLLSVMIVSQAKLHIESGDIQGIIDPSLHDEYDIQSMWKIAEKALMCVQAHGYMRPSISEVLKEIQDAILMERGAAAARDGNSDDTSKNSIHSSLNLGSLDLGGTDNYLSIDESIVRPTAR